MRTTTSTFRRAAIFAAAAAVTTTATLSAATDADAHGRGLTPIAAHVYPSVGVVGLTGAPGATAVLKNAAHAVVGSGTLDARGALVLRDLKAGAGYTFTISGGGTTTTTAPFAVLSTAAPAPSFYKATALHEGINYIPMRDGVTLAATLRLPYGKTIKQGPFPTVIEYSGYETAGPHSLIDAELGKPGHPLNDPLLPSTSTAVGALITPLLGFATVSLQMRGSGCSGGAFDLFGAQTTYDGYDAVETVANQSFVLGHKVGLVGISFSGISQLFVAGSQPPHLAAIAPLSPTDDLYSTGSPGGIFNNGFAAGWIADRVHDARPAPDGQNWANAEIAAGDTKCAANQQFHGQAQDINTLLAGNPARVANLYDPRSPVLWAKHISVPVFLVGGLQDEQTGPQWPALISALSHDKNVWVTMQNGTHVDSLSPVVLSRWMEFLNLFVAHKIPTAPSVLATIVLTALAPAKAAPFPAVRFTKAASVAAATAAFSADPRVRVLFDNGNSSAGPGALGVTYEAGFSQWPPATAAALRLNLGGSGALTTSTPSPGVVSFNPDPSLRPRTSLPSNGNAWAAQPAYNWTPVLGTSGAGFVTAPLSATTTVVGPASLDLTLASTASDTDLQVTVSEVRPNGQEMYVTSGFLRASSAHLNSLASTIFNPVPTYASGDVQLLTPGVSTTVRVPIDPIAYSFRSGSRIRITISAPGGDRPEWAFATFATGGTVTDTIALGGAKPSSLVLPVVSGITPKDAQPPCGSNRGQPCRTYIPAANGG